MSELLLFIHYYKYLIPQAKPKAFEFFVARF